IMGEPLSPDRVFDFPINEQEPHPAYDFFAPAPLPGYAGNPDNYNVWLKADDCLLGELEEMVDKHMVVPAIEEINALVMDIKEDLAALFGNDDLKDDASDGFGEEEVWEVNDDWLMAPTTPYPMLAVPPPSVYEVGGPSSTVAEGPSFPHLAPRLPVPPFVIKDLSICLGNLEYGHGQLEKKVIQVSDAEVAHGVSIGEMGPKIFAVEGQALQIDMQQRDTQIQQMQTTVTEMGSRESTLMRCVLGLDRQIAALERRPSGPQ
ncbi:hypothetical protein Tco_1421770, partial [Tanacetum coccineum]